jgi:hypothetical protein
MSESYPDLHVQAADTQVPDRDTTGRPPARVAAERS